MTNVKTMDLEVELTPSERAQAAEQLSERIDALLLLRQEHKDKKAAMKRREDEIEADVKRLARAHKTGKEIRPVFVEERPDLMRSVVEVVRTDTEEIVLTRPLSADEIMQPRQGTIPGVQ